MQPLHPTKLLPSGPVEEKKTYKVCLTRKKREVLQKKNSFEEH